jgi:hypothetical protein
VRRGELKGAIVQQQIDEAERLRRQELVRDSRAALALGMSVDEYAQVRNAAAEDWVTWMHAEMKKSGALDPTEILPAILARAEQRAAQIAREAARVVTAEMIQAAFRKAMT